MLVLKLILLIIATWRLYRLVARDTGPKCLFRRLRVWAGVRYGTYEDGTPDYTEWHTNDGSFAEMLMCCNCAPLWQASALTALLLFTPTWVFLAVTVPLVAGAGCVVFENLLGKRIN